MRTLSLNIAVKDVLQHGCTFLDGVSDEFYARPLGETHSSSLGAHYRHVLDHFICLAEGIRTGKVNYDERQRNPQLESSVGRARLATEALIENFRTLTTDVLQRECRVIYSVRYGEITEEPIRSNLAREVMFCVGHAIHHFAILRLLCADQGVKLPDEFGLAPSTARHIEARTASG